jgi:hypothetical protein
VVLTRLQAILDGDAPLFQSKEVTGADAASAPLLPRLAEALRAIQRGEAPDPHGWRLPVP